MRSEFPQTTRDEYSDGSYLRGHPTWHAERSPWKAAHVVEGLRRASISPRSICDIGAGSGEALATLGRLLPDVDRLVAFEPSPDAPLSSEAADLLDYRREDATETTDRFDVAIMLDVFEHVEDCYGFLRRCRPLAAHHVFHIPLDAHARNVIGNGLATPRRRHGHLHYFTRETALATMGDTGYEVLHWHYTKSGWEGPNRNPRSVSNVVCRLLFRVAPDLTQRLFGGLSLLVVTG